MQQDVAKVIERLTPVLDKLELTSAHCCVGEASLRVHREDALRSLRVHREVAEDVGRAHAGSR